MVRPAPGTVAPSKPGEQAMREEYENGILVGWWGTTFDRAGKQIKVFIPRRDEDVAADRRAAR